MHETLTLRIQFYHIGEELEAKRLVEYEMSLKPTRVPFMIGGENHNETRRAQDDTVGQGFSGR